MSISLNAETIEGFVKAFLLDRYHERRPTPDCHRQWWKMVTSNARNVALAAPRGHGKSTALNHAYGLCAALFKQHPFQIKVSKTYDLACEKIEQAKQELLDNEKIKHVFQLKSIIRDRENDFIAEMSDGYRFRMRALGMGQATRGLSWGTMRPTLILGDDMEDDEEVLSKERREKGMRWILNTLMPMGGEKTDYRFFGTILHNDSCLVKLLNMPSFKSGIWEACDGEISPKSILWPEKFTPEVLDAKKQEYVSVGNLAGFNMEYRNIARDTTSGYFRPEDFLPIGEAEAAQMADKLTYYVGVDFAISESERSDYTVMVVAGISDTGMLYIVDVVRLRTSDGNQIIDEMFSIERAYHPAEWFLEEGAIRKGLGAALELRQREEGVYLSMRMFVPTKEKTVRARNIQARIRARAVKFRTEAGWFDEYRDELEQFPRGKHDDQVDATAYIGIGLAQMVTPLTPDEEEEAEREMNVRESLSMGRSAVTGY